MKDFIKNMQMKQRKNINKNIIFVVQELGDS